MPFPHGGHGLRERGRTAPREEGGGFRPRADEPRYREGGEMRCDDPHAGEARTSTEGADRCGSDDAPLDGPAGTPPDPGSLEETLRELESEWRAISLELAELRAKLSPRDVRDAFRACGLGDLGEALAARGAADPPPVGPHPAPSPRARSGAGPDARARAAQPPRDLPASTPEEAANAAGAPHPQEGAAALAHGGEAGPRILELMALLRENLRNASPGRQPAVSIPREVTLEIAREVAGRLRDSLRLMRSEEGTLRGGSAAGGSGNEATAAPAFWEESGPEAPEKARIPLDDIAAVIDQLIKNG